MGAPSDLWIKVPSPFYGAETVGFSVRYPGAGADEPGLELPLFLEGEAELISPLQEELRPLSQREQFIDVELPGEAYAWSAPLRLADEVLVLSFRDRSLRAAEADPGRALRNRLSNQLVPLAFPFLRDCARVAGLRLNPRITVRITSDAAPELSLSLPLDQIVERNGNRTLV